MGAFSALHIFGSVQIEDPHVWHGANQTRLRTNRADGRANWKRQAEETIR